MGRMSCRLGHDGHESRRAARACEAGSSRFYRVELAITVTKRRVWAETPEAARRHAERVVRAACKRAKFSVGLDAERATEDAS